MPLVAREGVSIDFKFSAYKYRALKFVCLRRTRDSFAILADREIEIPDKY